MSIRSDSLRKSENGYSSSDSSNYLYYGDMTKSVVWRRSCLSTLSRHITTTWWRSFMQEIQQGKVSHFFDPPKNGQKTSKMAYNSVACRSWQAIRICLSSSHQYLSNDVTFLYFWQIFMEWKSTADLSATDCGAISSWTLTLPKSNFSHLLVFLCQEMWDWAQTL